MMWDRSTCFIFLIIQLCTAQNVNAFHPTKPTENWDVRPPDMSASKEGR